MHSTPRNKTPKRAPSFLCAQSNFSVLAFVILLSSGAFAQEIVSAGTLPDADITLTQAGLQYGQPGLNEGQSVMPDRPADMKSGLAGFQHGQACLRERNADMHVEQTRRIAMTADGRMPPACSHDAGPELVLAQGGQKMARWTVAVRIVPRGASSGTQTNVTVTAGSEPEARAAAVAETERKKPGHVVTAVSARKIG